MLMGLFSSPGAGPGAGPGSQMAPRQPMITRQQAMQLGQMMGGGGMGLGGGFMPQLPGMGQRSDSENLMMQMYGQSPFQQYQQGTIPGRPGMEWGTPNWDWLEGIKKRAQEELKKKRRNAFKPRSSNPNISGGGTPSGPGSGGR